MNDSSIDLGKRLRQFRRRAGLNLSALAEKSQCSESMLSKIETGRGNPSLNLLRRIARALDVSIGHMLAEDQGESVVMRQGMRSVISTLTPDQGVTLEALMSRQEGHLLQAHIHNVTPGGGNDTAIFHEGEEVGYVLEGELELEVDGEAFQLRQGDSFFFSSHLSHRYSNKGDRLARILWVNTPPTF